jgi:hypothetical protein
VRMKIFYTKDEVAHLLKCRGVREVDDMIAAHEIKSKRVGEEELISWSEVLRLRKELALRAKSSSGGGSSR